MEDKSSIFGIKSLLAMGLAVLLGFVLYFIGFETPRESFNQFILLYIAAFTLFYILWINRQQWDFRMFLVVAILLRLILFFAVPELSNDFYRFIWDGELISRGINPYAHIPNELISQGPFYNDQYMRILYHGMGEYSQAHYSCYPVLNQLFFYVPAALFESVQYNVLGLKVIIILADIGVIFIGKKILDHLKMPSHKIWLYALNPFVLLEFAGNLHFEGVMIFFLLLGIYYGILKNFLLGGSLFGLSVQVKLIPLMLLPFLFKSLKWRRALGYTAMAGVVILLLSQLMLTPKFYDNFMTSIDLYTQNFEFNASIFYLFREYSFSTVGFDEIAFYGPFLSKIALVGIVLLALVKAVNSPKDIFTGMLFALVIYYALATTVHPWYVGMILICSIFTRYKFGLIWTLLVMLSYSAYSNTAFQENWTYLLIEYVLVFGIMIVEVVKFTSSKDIGLQIKSFFSNE